MLRRNPAARMLAAVKASTLVDSPPFAFLVPPSVNH